MINEQVNHFLNFFYSTINKVFNNNPIHYIFNELKSEERANNFSTLLTETK